MLTPLLRVNVVAPGPGPIFLLFAYANLLTLGCSLHPASARKSFSRRHGRLGSWRPASSRESCAAVRDGLRVYLPDVSRLKCHDGQRHSYKLWTACRSIVRKIKRIQRKVEFGAVNSYKKCCVSSQWQKLSTKRCPEQNLLSAVLSLVSLACGRIGVPLQCGSAALSPPKYKFEVGAAVPSFASEITEQGHLQVFICPCHFGHTREIFPL